MTLCHSAHNVKTRSGAGRSTEIRARRRHAIMRPAVTVTAEKKRAPLLVELYRSAVGKKWVMGVTGATIIGFVLVHMVGNWKIFFPDVAGVAEIDLYGEALRSLLFPILPETAVLWIFRTVLIVVFLLHVHSAYALTLMSRQARDEPYRGPRRYLAADYAGRTMRASGTIFLAWLLFHLADMTLGRQPAAPEHWEHGEIYANFVASFSRAPVAIIYIVAMGLLASHLYHGAWSMFQSVGANHPRFNPWRRMFAVGLAALVFVGNSIMPVAVMAGWVG